MFKSVIMFAIAVVPSIADAQWYGSVDYVVPTRTVTRENVFQRGSFEVFDDSQPPVSLGFQVDNVNRLSLDFDFVSGRRATAGFHMTQFFGVEGSYLVTEQLNTMSTVSDASGLLASPFTAPGSAPDPLVDNNTFASVAYQTKLESVELNLTLFQDYPTGRGMWKFGVRALRLNEEFQYCSTNAMMDNTLLTTTDNRIIGPQVGFHGMTEVPGGAIALSLSGLVGYNDMKRTSVFNDVPTTWDTNEASLVGDASIEYLLAPHPNVLIRIGFQVLGLGRVGLAPNDPMINNDQTDSVGYSLPYVGVVVVR